LTSVTFETGAQLLSFGTEVFAGCRFQSPVCLTLSVSRQSPDLRVLPTTA
jgi:hypothetical protein